MAIDERLLAMFRCPESGGELHWVADGDGPGFLVCAESRLKFAINELEIPNLLLEDAERLEADEVESLLAKS